MIDREERHAIMRQCAEDVCSMCGKRARGYSEARGPNAAGNYAHVLLEGPGPVGGEELCAATAIHARITWELLGK